MLASSTTRVAVKEILVATDFSAASEHALDYAVSLARRYDSRVNLAHVITTAAYATATAEGAVDTFDMVRQNCEIQLHLVSQRVASDGLAVRQTLGSGSPAVFLGQLCEQDSIDLIVLGTHGAQGVKRFLLGSVTEEIVRSAKCPALVIGPHVHRRPQMEARFKSILFATDLSATSEPAAAYALSLAQEFEARLTLLHVVPGDGHPAPDSDRVAHYFLKELKSYIPEDAPAWCQLDYAVRYGDAGQQIAEIAQQLACDLVVLGARQQSHTDSLFRSSTAYSVMCSAPCPVLTVRG